MDLILAEGTIFIFQMGMAILKMSALDLMTLDMELMIRVRQFSKCLDVWLSLHVHFWKVLFDRRPTDGPSDRRMGLFSSWLTKRYLFSSVVTYLSSPPTPPLVYPTSISKTKCLKKRHWTTDWSLSSNQRSMSKSPRKRWRNGKKNTPNTRQKKTKKWSSPED